MIQTFHSTIFQRYSYGLRSGDFGDHFIPLNSLTRLRLIWALWHWVGCGIYIVQLILSGPQCDKKISSNIAPAAAKFCPTICMLQLLKCCMFLESRLTKPGNIFPIFNCPVLVSMGKLLPHFPVLSWQGCHPVQYSAAVAHFAQDSRFSVHSEIFFLLTWFWQVVVWILLLSYQVETVWHSPLTSDISTASHWLFFSFSKGWKP